VLHYPGLDSYLFQVTTTVLATSYGMAQALLGKIDHFDADAEEWPQYVERLEHFFDANGITGEDNKAKRRSVFLTVIGPSPYKLLRNLLAPEKPADKTFEQLTGILQEHYNPKPSEVMQRFRFNSRSRKAGESVADYIADLRRIAEFCNYGASLEAMIRDRLVCGINDDAIQRKLLAETELTYAKSLTIAKGLEAAAQNLKEMKMPKREITANAGTVQKVATYTPTGTSKVQSKELTCHRCGNTGHLAPQCSFKEAICDWCHKKGHLARVCMHKAKGKLERGAHEARPFKKQGTATRRKPVRYVEDDSGSDAEGDSLLHICTVSKPNSKTPPIQVKIIVDECNVDMEVDTGASVTIMAESEFYKLWPGRSLDKTEVKLQSYSKETIPVLGCTQVSVCCGNQVAQLPLIVVKGTGPTLLGRNWLLKIKLNWAELHYAVSSDLNSVIDKYSAVFEEGLGTYQGYQAKIHVDPNATPRFFKPRTVPYSMREGIEAELNKLVAEGTLVPVEHSDWAAPIVPVLKPDGKTVRICGDFRLTVNPVSKLDQYPIPKIEDLFATLERGEKFTKLDLSQAYQQLTLDDSSQKYVVINTHKGLFKYTRMPYGISSAPGIFQRTMEVLLQGIPGVTVYIDDILITGKDDQDHLKSLEEVLSRLARVGLRAKRHKCKFMMTSVSYLGYVIDAEGLHPVLGKIQAIKDAPIPNNITELKSYLGLLSYYGKFLQNRAQLLAPLYQLLSSSNPWVWTDEQTKAFEKSKEMLTSKSLLVHFNPNLPITLACDASSYGIGAVLAHRMSDGSEKPIGYASRTLSKAERNYSQLEKEGLSCIFGIKRFYSYLFGHSFELITDHKPLLGLLGEHKPTSPQSSARIRRWSLYLSQFEYTLKFRRTAEHANADALSRLPLQVEPATSVIPPEVVLLTEHLSNSPVTADQIAAWTTNDLELSPVVQFLRQGWPNTLPDDKKSELSPFFKRQHELSLYNGCILWGNRVIVPKRGREMVLVELHEGHLGMTKMKSMARMYVWWPNITQDIETLVQACEECQRNQSAPPVAPLSPWSWPTRPWARLHLDYAGPVQGKMYLIVIDAHSKWIEAFNTSTATSSAVIEELRVLFARFGIPETVVTDNGTCFTSFEFEEFLQKNGVKHLTSAPYHPSSNGLAERAVQIVKKGLKKITTGTPRSRLAKILMTYRLAPQTTTGSSPSELLLGRRPRSRLDLLKPNTADRVESQQRKQKAQHDTKAKERKFDIGDAVFLRNYREGEKWLSGCIVEKIGPVSIVVELDNGQKRHCHTDQIRKRTAGITSLPDMEIEREIAMEEALPNIPVIENAPENSSTTTPDVESESVPSSPQDADSTSSGNAASRVLPRVPETTTPSPVKTPAKTYPKRDRRPVERYSPSKQT